MQVPTSVISSSWPVHLIPMCLDGGSIAKLPFPFVIDVAHIVDSCALHYYPAPTLIAAPRQPTQPTTPFSSAVERRASVAASQQQRKRSVVGFSPDGGGSPSSPTAARLQSPSSPSDENDFSLTDALLSPSPTKPNGRRRSSAASAQPAAPPQDKFEVQMQPAGTVLLVGGSFHEPRRSASGAEQRSFADEEKYYVLAIPNLRMFLLPQNPEQLAFLQQYLPQWIRVSNQQMFNSRVLLVRAEFSAVPMGRAPPPPQSNGTDDGDAAWHIYQQQCLRDDLDFCRHLTSAVFALGTFHNAREATNDKGVPDQVVQRTLSLSSVGGAAKLDSTSEGSPSKRSAASHAADVAAMGKKFATIVVPFTFGNQDRLAVAVKHEALGWYVPAHQRSSASVMQLLASHDVSKPPLVVELAPKQSVGGSDQLSRRKSGHSIRDAVNSRVRVLCKFSWVADENFVLRVALKASSLLRRDFFLTDPVCFVSAKPQAPGGANGEETTAPPAPTSDAQTYKYVTEAYRNKLDAQFCPMMFALPMDIPKCMQSNNLIDFVAESEGKGQTGSGKKQTAMLRSNIFPPNVLPPVPAPQVSVADIRSDHETAMSTVFTGHRFGDDILLPYVQSNETLTIEVVDAAYDPITKDTLPSLVGSAHISVQELLDKADAATTTALMLPPALGKKDAGGGTTAADATRLSLALPTGTNSGAVTINSSTPASTIDRIRARQKKRFPVAVNRFVFHSVAEAVSSENSHMLLRNIRGPELHLGSVTKQLRPSFLSFFQGGQWDLSSMIIVDATPSALWAHFNSFLPNDMPGANDIAGTTPSKAQSQQHGGANKGKNIFEAVITALNRLLVPILTRGGSDLYVANRGQDGHVSLTPVHNYPDGFGVHVDEASSKGLNATEVFSNFTMPVSSSPTMSFRSTSTADTWGDVPSKPPAENELGGLNAELLMDAAAEVNREASPPQQPQTQPKQTKQIFSVIRDWGGEGTLRALSERIETIVLRTRAAVGLPNPDDFLDKTLAELQSADPGGSPRKVQTSKTLVLPPPPQMVPRLPIQLAPLLRRSMARCVALTRQRRLTALRANSKGGQADGNAASSIPLNPFHVVTIMIHSEVEDLSDCITLLLSWLARPVFFIFAFLDDSASSQFSGIPNCITIDLACCSKAQQHEQRSSATIGTATSIDGHRSSTTGGGAPNRKDSPAASLQQGGVCHCLTNYEVPLTSVHKQLHALESVVQRLPLAFLNFARLCGVQPESITIPNPTTFLASPQFHHRAPLSTSKSGRTTADEHGSAPQHSVSFTTSPTTPRRAETAAQRQQDERARLLEKQQAALDEEHHKFTNAREKFLYAFGFKKKPPPPAKVGGGRPGSSMSAPPGSILQNATTGKHPQAVGSSSSPTKATFVSDDGDREGATGSPSQTATERGAVAVVPTDPQRPSDFRGAMVSIVDVYMNDEQIREWETDPQRLRSKLQAFRSGTPRAAGSAGGGRVTSGSVVGNVLHTDSFSSPLVDDSLIRLHLQRLRSTSASGEPDRRDDVGDDDVELEDSVLSGEGEQQQEAIQLLSRRTRQDGHWKQSNVKVNGMELFANKLPQPPSNGRRSASAGKGNRRISTASQRPDDEKDTDGGGSDDEDKENEILSARQMALRRERLETEQAVERALTRVLGSRAKQHLQKPQLHSRLLSANSQMEQRRKSSIGSAAGEDPSHDALSVSGRPGQSSSLMPKGSVLPDEAKYFREYLKHSQTSMLSARVNDRIALSLSRPSTAGSSRGSSRLSQYVPTRPDSARNRDRGSSAAFLKRASGGDGAGDDEDEANVRFQQLPFDKRLKLQQLLNAEHRSFGGPRLQEEVILEQEAELDRRRLKNSRKRETERVEELFRDQKAAEQLERNRAKLHQMLLNSQNGDEDDLETTKS